MKEIKKMPREEQGRGTWALTYSTRFHNQELVFRKRIKRKKTNGKEILKEDRRRDRELCRRQTRYVSDCLADPRLRFHRCSLPSETAFVSSLLSSIGFKRNNNGIL